jgi:hypothetical protein
MLKWNYKAALKKMEVGDSFFIPTLDLDGLMASITWAAYDIGIAVIVHRCVSSGALGLRVWRVPDKKVGDAKEE